MFLNSRISKAQYTKIGKITILKLSLRNEISRVITLFKLKAEGGRLLPLCRLWLMVPVPGFRV